MAEGFKPQRPPSLILAKGFRNETLTPSLHQNPDLGIISPRHIVRSVIGKLSQSRGASATSSQLQRERGGRCAVLLATRRPVGSETCTGMC